jgi:hypothetical protein
MMSPNLDASRHGYAILKDVADRTSYDDAAVNRGCARAAAATSSVVAARKRAHRFLPF